MARQDPKFSNLGDGVVNLLDGIAKFMLTIGGLAGLLGIGFLLYSFFGSAQAGPEQIANFEKYIDVFRNAALWGLLSASLGAGWLLWAEETAGPIMLIVGLALVFSPAYLSPGTTNAEFQGDVLSYLRIGGFPLVFVGAIMVMGEMISRMKLRMRQGARAESMKYGKGVKEERDVRNVFMGKCWQLPYCRKFVRERCPIYHAKRTCWKERVGCMCEESVIKNAMDNQVIAKDAVAAAKMIPRNNKLTPGQKAERCRQCVIYNEHQKHKYRLALPITALTIAGIYVGLRVPLGNAILNALTKADQAGADLGITGANTEFAGDAAQTTSLSGGSIPYHEIILVVCAFVLLAYAIKVLEYLFFRLKA